MKQITILLTALMLVGAMFGTDNQTDLQKQKLKGKVRSVSDEESVDYYNKAGYYASKSYDDYYSSGDIYYTYNDQNQIASMEEEDYYDGFIYGEYYTYSNDGLLTKINYVSFGKETTKNFEYNDNKQKIWKKEYSYDTVSKLLSAVEYAYDKDGNMVKENYYDKDMTLVEYTEYRYDKAKNLIERASYKPTKELKNKTLYKYDSKNRLIEETLYVDNKLSYKTTISYDDHNNETKKVTTDSTAKVSTISYVYTYDANGNWLTKEISENGKQSSTYKREISYFED